jgi:hypothetical protein
MGSVEFRCLQAGLPTNENKEAFWIGETPGALIASGVLLLSSLGWI